MADLRIVDAPEIPTENITGEEKLPTGGNGNYSISLDSLADYTKTKKDLADNTSVDGKVNGVRQELEAHVEDLLNPHQVTKGQIGLGNVDNTADLDKPVSNSTQAAIISAVTPKADKTYVDNALSSKSDKTYVDNALSSKSDKTYVDTQLTLKANKADVYTKAETYTKQESNDLVSSSISTALTPVNTSLDLAKRGIANRYDSSLTYNSGERVILTNGTIVVSTIPNNTNNPNTDMTGWELDNAAHTVNDSRGVTQQQINDTFVTPEMFGVVANDPDARSYNGDRLNTMFATGKPVLTKKGDIYYIGDGVVTKGQTLHGGATITQWLEVAQSVTFNNDVPDKSKFRAMYVSTSSDVVDFLKIKSLGFNTIIHYMHNTTSDRVSEQGYTLVDMLNSAKSANLDVILSTEAWVTTAQGYTLDTYIALAETYENVKGFYLYDEPSSAGHIPIATQNARIAEHRALTKLPLYVAENALNVFNAPDMSSNFDVYLVDVYTARAPLLGTTALEGTLGMASLCYLQFRERFPKAKVYPVGDAYYRSGDTAGNKSDMDVYTRKWSQVADGNYAFFTWDSRSDASIVTNAKGSADIQETLRACSVAKGNFTTDGALFGRVVVGPYDSIDNGTVNLYNRLKFSHASDIYALPSNILSGIIKGTTGGSVDTRNFDTTGFDPAGTYLYSGLIFRNQDAWLHTDIKVYKLSAAFVLRSVKTVNCTITFYETHDGGFTRNQLWTGSGFSDPNQISFFGVQGTGGDLLIRIQDSAATNDGLYRSTLCGGIVSANW